MWSLSLPAEFTYSLKVNHIFVQSLICDSKISLFLSARDKIENQKQPFPVHPLFREVNATIMRNLYVLCTDSEGKSQKTTMNSVRW